MIMLTFSVYEETTSSQYRDLWTSKITKTPIQRGNTNSHACSYTGSNETYFKEHNSDLHTATTRSEETGGLHYNPVTATECDWNTHTHFYRHTCSTSRPHVSTAMLWKHSEHLINSCSLTQCRHQLTNTVAFKREKLRVKRRAIDIQIQTTQTDRGVPKHTEAHTSHTPTQTCRNIHMDSRMCHQKKKNIYMQEILWKLINLSWKIERSALQTSSLRPQDIKDLLHK